MSSCRSQFTSCLFSRLVRDSGMHGLKLRGRASPSLPACPFLSVTRKCMRPCQLWPDLACNCLSIAMHWGSGVYRELHRASLGLCGSQHAEAISYERCLPWDTGPASERNRTRLYEKLRLCGAALPRPGGVFAACRLPLILLIPLIFTSTFVRSLILNAAPASRSARVRRPLQRSTQQQSAATVTC